MSTDENSRRRGRRATKTATPVKKQKQWCDYYVIKCLEKIKWKEHSAKYRQDWYDRAFSKYSTSQTGGLSIEDLHDKEYLANVALFGSKGYAAQRNIDSIKSGGYQDQVIKDPETGEVVNILPMIDSLNAIKEHYSDYINEESEFDPLDVIEATMLDVDNSCRYGFISDASREGTSIQPTDISSILDRELYEELVELSNISTLARMTVARYIRKSGYINYLSEEQAEFWEADFQLLDCLAIDTNNKAGVVPVSVFIQATNTNQNEYNKLKKYILKTLSKYCQRYGSVRPPKVMA